MKRAPVWFTHGKTKDKISRWWPWAAGILTGAAYWYDSSPFEQVRVGTLYAVRRPVLQGSQWLEVRDVDPETMALDLPPDQIFGPLTLNKQIKFVMQALNEDNELADGYVTRLVIDHMDLSLDPPFLGESLEDAGGMEILRFAVKDFLDQRENAKCKFFDADRFIRWVSVCANHPSMAKEFVDQHDGVNLIFKAMGEATNEYARVLGMRCVTLFAFQQERDGDVERAILRGGYLKDVIANYRQSTGDPTDTRFATLLLSSILRQLPKEAYQAMVEANIVKATVNNLNISRYKGVPQHIRILQDLEKARLIVEASKAKKGSNAASLSAAEEEALKEATLKKSSRAWFGLFAKDSTEDANRAKAQLAQERAGTSSSTGGLKDLTGVTSPASSRRKIAADSSGIEPVRWESHRENPNDLPDLPPPRDPQAPMQDLLVESDFLPVALGICDIFPEYFEANREIIHLLHGLKGAITPFDLFEHRFFNVANRLFGRHCRDHDFEAHGMGAALADMAQWIFDDPECRPYLDPECTATNTEIKTSIKNMREFLQQREERLKAGETATTQRHLPLPT